MHWRTSLRLRTCFGWNLALLWEKRTMFCALRAESSRGPVESRLNNHKWSQVVIPLSCREKMMRKWEHVCQLLDNGIAYQLISPFGPSNFFGETLFAEMGAKQSVSVRIWKMRRTCRIFLYSKLFGMARCPQDQLDGFRHVRCRFWQSDRHSIILSKGEETCRETYEILKSPRNQHLNVHDSSHP